MSYGCEICGEKYICDEDYHAKKAAEELPELKEKLRRTEAALARCREQRKGWYIRRDMRPNDKFGGEETLKYQDAELDAILEGD